MGTFLNDRSNEYLPIVPAAGFVGRLSDLFAVIIEPAYAFVVGDRTVGLDGFLLTYGVRLSGTNFGVDLLLVRPFGVEEDNPFILGFPWLAVTYRTDGSSRTQEEMRPPEASSAIQRQF